MLNAIKIKKIPGSLWITILLAVLASCRVDPQERLLSKIEKHQDRLRNAMEDSAVNKEMTLETAGLFKDYIQQYPDDTGHIAKFYYEATRLYALGGNYSEAIALADTFRIKHPDDPMAPLILFLKGSLIYETEMKDYDKARETYLTFINTYPDHSLVPDVLFSLEHLGQSGEQIMEDIKRKSKSHGDQDSTSAH